MRRNNKNNEVYDNTVKNKKRNTSTGSRHSIQKKNTFTERLLIGVIAVMLIFTFSFSFGSFFSSAHDAETITAPKTKFFKSIQIEKGDTLWTIAETYRTEEYDSVKDYMQELIRINGIDRSMEDHLKAGDYLTVVIDEL